MAVHDADWGGAQVVALGQARTLRGEYDLVIAIGHGPLRSGFAEAATAVVGRPTNLPIWVRPTAGGRCRSPARCPMRSELRGSSYATGSIS